MNNFPQITLSFGNFKNQPVVFVNFKFNWNIVEQLKKYEKSTFIPSEKRWWIPQNIFDLGELKKNLGDKIEIDSSALKIKVPDSYLALLQQKRYSENTIKTYLLYFENFIDYFIGSDLNEISIERINNYILELIEQKNISHSQQNQRINAIKFYYEKVLGRETEYYNIERPRQDRKLPDVLSKEEVGKMLKTTKNLKHKTIIALIYSCGLRRNESINIKISDIDSKRMLIKIRGAKGKKDRYVQLSPNVLPLLREYYRREKPKIWIFEGAPAKQYSAVSVYNVVKNAAKKAGIRKRVYPHILRHSYATHHLEQGTDLRFIQEWLGHDSSKTTEIYTHVSNNSFIKFINPIDDITLSEKLTKYKHTRPF